LATLAIPPILNVGGTLNSRTSFIFLTQGLLPSPDVSISATFAAWRQQLMDLGLPGITKPAISRITGDWYEWLVGIAAWNYRIANPTSVVSLKPAIRGHFKTGHRDWPET